MNQPDLEPGNDHRNSLQIHAAEEASTHPEGIYVCSRVVRAPVWLHYRERGAPIISSWIDEAGEGETADFAVLWARIRHEVQRCRALVFYAKDMTDFPFKGAFVEIGMALAFGKPVFVYLGADVKLEGRTYRPLGSWIEDKHVKMCDTLEQAMQLASNSPLPSNATLRHVHDHALAQRMSGTDRYAVGYNAGIEKMAYLWKRELLDGDLP